VLLVPHRRRGFREGKEGPLHGRVGFGKGS
jgi:hypothetical protein